MEGTKYLPSLHGKKWDDDADSDNSLTQTQRLLIKRAKFHVNIILEETDPKSKYELFQRLNTGGSQLSEQEVRNCILVSLNREMYFWIRELSRDENFTETVALTDKASNEQYDLSLVLRFLLLRDISMKEMKEIGDVNDFLTEKMIEIAEKKDYDRGEAEKAFKETFQLLANTSGDNSFRRYDKKKNKFMGGFILSAYEAIALGVGYNYSNLNAAHKIEDGIKAIWANKTFIDNSGSGVRASSRIPSIVPLGRRIFAL